jgi:hypothetical protein
MEAQSPYQRSDSLEKFEAAVGADVSPPYNGPEKGRAP